MADRNYDWTNVEQQLRQYGGNLYDPTDLEGIRRNTGYDVGGSSLDSALQNQYKIYDQRRQSSTPTLGGGAYSSGGGAADQNLSQFLQYLQQRDQANSQQQQGYQNILMQQLGQLGNAPTVNDPGIAENLAGQRLALQRSAERQRAQNATELGGQGLANSGAAQTGRLGIEQARGEAEARGVGQVLGNELQGRRDQLSKLLSLATQLGDAESARTLQAQLAAINAQLGQSNFYDTQALNYASLNQNANLQALLGLLNAA